jgi:large subunit ribosomal protein L29
MARKNEKTAVQLASAPGEELRQDLVDSQKELFSIRFQLATGAQTDSSQIRTVKRRIARIHTVIREKELGIKQIAGKRKKS